MPKEATRPFLIDRCYTLSLADLKRMGLLSEDNQNYIEINFKEDNLRCEIRVNNLAKGEPRKFYKLIITYHREDSKQRQEFNIIGKPSNLGKGEVLYIVCNVKNRLFRKLYFSGSYFSSRYAFKGIAYYNQTLSKPHRNLAAAGYLHERKAKRLVKEMNSSRKTYAGKVTRRQIELQRQLLKALDRQQQKLRITGDYLSRRYGIG